MSIVVPAVLPANKKDLEDKLAFFASLPPVSRVQIDVVDGKFVGSASWPYTAMSEMDVQIQRGETLPYLEHIEYEIDFMCLDAPRAIGKWIALGATRFVIHAGTAPDLPRCIGDIRKRYGTAEAGIKLGVAVPVTSDVALLDSCISNIEFVQCMGIAQIGRQGEPFDERVLQKIRAFHAKHPEVPLQVDGGVSLLTAGKILSLGVSHLIVGSALLRADNPLAVISALDALYDPCGAVDLSVQAGKSGILVDRE
jgi:ribulose-phosphate 3-epimerase